VTKLPCEYLEINDYVVPVQSERIGNRFEWHSTEPGTFCLSKAKHVKFYSALIWKNGGYISVYDGTGRLVWAMPSIFTGSFVVDAYCENGLYVRVGAGPGLCPSNTICWLEQDA